jgi:hypothetical protein
MLGKRCGAWAGLVILAGLLRPVAAEAGDLFDWWPWKQCLCPPSSYSCCHYWTQQCYRLDAFCHPQGYMYSTNRYPQQPPRFLVTQFPCRAVDPATAMSGTSYAHLFEAAQKPAAAAEAKPAAEGSKEPEQLKVMPTPVPKEEPKP